MTLLMRDQENIEKGKSVGEEMMLMLIQKLVDNNRFDDISKIKENKEYRQKLYKEYNISYWALRTAWKCEDMILLMCDRGNILLCRWHRNISLDLKSRRYRCSLKKAECAIEKECDIKRGDRDLKKRLHVFCWGCLYWLIKLVFVFGSIGFMLDEK